MPDLKIAKDEGLVRALRRCKEKCVADGTYRNPVFVNKEHGRPKPLSTLIRRILARHEALNSRFKRFAIFKLVRGFRHDIETHAIYFNAIANLTQIELEIESPLFDLRREINAFDRYYKRYCKSYNKRYLRRYRQLRGQNGNT
jgi:hypothetical protein